MFCWGLCCPKMDVGQNLCGDCIDSSSPRTRISSNLFAISFSFSHQCFIILLKIYLVFLTWSFPNMFSVDTTDETTFLVSVSDNLGLVYSIATYFCVVILHLETLLNSFVTSDILSLWCVICTRGNVTFCFAGCTSFSVTWLLWLGLLEPSLIKIIKMCFVPNLGDKASSFSPFSMRLDVSLLYMICTI